MFTGLVVGVAGSILPMLLRNQPPAAERTPRARVFHLSMAALYWATFWLEPLTDARLAFGLRGLILLAVLLAAGMWRPPTAPGWHRRLAFAAPWFLPASAFAVAIWPEYRKAGLHLGFLGCFAAMAFAVSIHVTLSHGGRADAVNKRLWQVAAIAGGLAIAIVGRVMVDVDPLRFRWWLGLASSAFLATTVAWWGVLWPTLIRRAPSKVEA
jgi:hypothetical protein